MNQDRVLNLVARIYDAAQDPSVWNAVLQELVDLTGATGADLAAYDIARGRASIHASVGIMNADFKRDYEAVTHIDPFLTKARDRRLFRTGLIGIGEDLIPLRELERTEFYDAFGHKHAYFGGLAAVIAAGGGSMAAIGVSRRRDHEFGPRELELMRTLMPHLQRSWDIHLRLAGLKRERSSFTEALNRLSLAMLVVGSGGTIVFANDTARALLVEGDGLIDDGGVLRGARSQDTSALDALIGGALTTAMGCGVDAGGVLQLDRPSGRRALRVMVSPLPASDRLAIAEPRVLIFVTDPEDRREPDSTILRLAFGLTPSETEIATLLMQDLSVKQISEWLGVTVHTVRFHVKQLLAKTGTTRQGGLVRLLSATAQIRRL